MGNYKPDEPKLKSYVFHGDRCFFVSTIMRDSSAAISPPPRFAETMTWEMNWATQERGAWVDQDGSGDALTQHMRVVSDFYKYGKRKDEDE